MRQIIILTVIVFLTGLNSCKNKQSQNFKFQNKSGITDLKMITFKYISSTSPITLMDTVFSKAIEANQEIDEDIPEGRYLLVLESQTGDSCYFHFYIKNNSKINLIYDENIKTKNKSLNEYNKLMLSLQRFEKNIFELQIKNIKNLQPIYETYLDSLMLLKSSVAHDYINLILEEELYFDYVLNPIISSKYNEKIGNFYMQINGTIIQLNGGADSLKQIGFYNRQAYKEYLNTILRKIQTIDNQDFFLEGKIYFILKQLDFDVTKAHIIANYIDTTFYPMNKFIENQIATTNNKNYAENLLRHLVEHYNDNPELSLKYNKLFIRDFYDSRYVRSGEAQTMINYHSFPIGSKSPGFAVKKVNGEIIQLSSFKNSYLLLDFWGTWCAPCRKEIPLLNKLYDNRSHLGIEILGLAKDRPNVLKEFLESNEVRYEVAIATNEIIKEYGVLSYPTKILIDKSGKLIAYGVQIHEIERLINEYEQ